MDYGYTIFILLLPLFSFLVLGLAGMKMSHKTAGLIGTCSLGVVTILSYLCAFQYFGADRVNDIYQTIVPYNFTWLPLGSLHFDLGILLIYQRPAAGFGIIHIATDSKGLILEVSTVDLPVFPVTLRV